MGDRIQRLNQVAQDGDIDAKIQRLNGIAQQGDIDAFYNIIREDVKLLEHIDEFPFVDTPLHISASAGHFPFSHEMMILKPTFVSKRYPNGYTPIYIALLNGHTEMVRHLLQHNADLVRVKGRECITPLHYAATKNDNLALLENFLSVCPDSITDVTSRNETALHIALNYNNLEAFKFLVGWLLRKWPYCREILQLKDVEGKTILHIAVSKNQTQAVSHLLALGRRFVNINEKNLEGETALEILEGQQRQEVENNEMRDILDRAGALRASSLPTVTSSHEHYLRLPGCWERKKIICNQVRKRISDDKRNALLVVAALLVTVTYQAILSPPGGLPQDDLFKPNSNITAPQRAGSAIAKETLSFPSALFVGFNSIIFLSSITGICVLVPPGESVGSDLALVSGYLCVCYFSALMILARDPDWHTNIVFISLWSAMMILLFVVAIALKELCYYLLNPIRKVQKYIYSRAWSYCM